MLKSYVLVPSFAFSDVPDQYCHLLERICPLINTDLEDHEPPDENSSSLPILPLTGSITFPNSIEIIISAIYIIDGDLNYETDSENMVVSIDFEWTIFDFDCVKINISVVQIGTNLSNDKRH